MDFALEFAAFLTALVCSTALTPLVRTMAFRWNFVAHPRADRWHQKPTALLGGIAIFGGFWLPALFFVPWAGLMTRPVQGLLLGSLFIFLLGLKDDIAPLDPQTKLLGQIIIAALVIPFGVVSEFFHPAVGIAITIFWIVGITNSFNLLDNMDGLCAGIAFITGLVLFAHSTFLLNKTVGLIASLVAGSTLGFLFYNFNPASIFMGDCGSLFLGFILGSTAVVGNYHDVSDLLSTLVVPLLLLLIPIFDTTLVTVMRTLHGRPVSQGGKDHVSHRLVKLGLSERNAVLFLYLLAILCGSVGVSYRHFSASAIGFLVLLVILSLGIFGLYLGEVPVYAEGGSVDGSQSPNGDRVLLSGRVMFKKRILEVILDSGLVMAGLIGAFLLRYDGVLDQSRAEAILLCLPILIPLHLGVFQIFGLYRGVWRYAGIHDTVTLFKANLLATLAGVGIARGVVGDASVPLSVFIIHFMLSLLLTVFARFSFRLLRETFLALAGRGPKTLLLGSGEGIFSLLSYIKQQREFPIDPIGMVVEDERLRGSMVGGVPILGTLSDLESICATCGVERMIFLEGFLNEEWRERIRNFSPNGVPELVGIRPQEMVVLPGGAEQ